PDLRSQRRRGQGRRPGCRRQGTEGRAVRHHRRAEDRKSTRLNSSHVSISYAVCCVKKKTFGFGNESPFRSCGLVSNSRVRPLPLTVAYAPVPAPSSLSLHDALPIYPISVPSGVEVKVDGQDVAVKGPKGELSVTIAEPITVSLEDGVITVSRPDEERESRSLHGLSRTLINNMIVGVTEGYSKALEIVEV